MRLLVSVLALVLVSVGQAHAQNYGPANYVLPLCKAWLKIAVEGDINEVGSIAQIEPIRLTSSGMCAGVVIGIAEALRILQFACPQKPVSNEQIVRTVVEEIENHPDQVQEEFSVLASEAILTAWPCLK